MDEMNIIKAIIMDVDGTLTDGQIYIGANGELFKGFYCRDGLGILHAKTEGIIPVILTSRESTIVLRRASELGIQYVLQGAGNEKLKVLDQFVREKGIRYDELAYIGDDTNDLDCMKRVKMGGGIVACPADAVDQVRNIANYKCKVCGGKGAVREFIEAILANEI